MTKKLAISLSDEIVAKLDKFQKETGLNRSAAIQVCILDYFKQKEAMDFMPELAKKIEDLKELNAKL
jgi:metal-responsive CopG/Arc/MetJ family transcriptional regulator